MVATRKITKAAPAKSKAKATNGKPKKMSAIDAAAKVLADFKQPLNAKEMIEAMSTKGLWTSPGGATPWATLYSAIIRELKVKERRHASRRRSEEKFAAN